MAYLLDTHALIWFLEGDDRLSAKAKEIISDDNSDIYLSMASLWEMAIKISLAKLNLSQSLEQVIETIEKQSILLLSVKPTHLMSLINLPFVHRDPFDRLLISQVLTEKMEFISNEALFLQYGIERVW